LVVGASLGLGGVQMQTLLDNPLASPYTLGLAAAAGLGAALALYTGGLGRPPQSDSYIQLTPAAAPKQGEVQWCL
ncbi:iron chelate uptake ABC transporter family permease subunit, partial [Aeromonas salmonicida]|uniref:iron chelate uptake ABC transporter family permease subunit n=1 Tax=Aeromonas salmonicida TaxID=645 RepID=UPI003D318006